MTTEQSPNVPEWDLARGFRDVDRTGDATHFVRFLEGTGGMAWVRQLKRRSYERMQIQPGHRVLDVGCGLGDDVRALAALVGPDGQAVGVDGSAAMIDEARRRSEGTGQVVDFALGDAQGLDFADSSFDACRTERLLQHVQEPARVVAEMVRVTRSGGHVVAYEQDYETLVFYPGEKQTTRSIALAFGDSIRHGWIGRQLVPLFLEAGLVEVTPVPEVLVSTELALARQLFLDAHLENVKQTGLLPAHQVDAWLAGLVEAHQRGTFLWGFTMYGAVGRKP